MNRASIKVRSIVTTSESRNFPRPDDAKEGGELPDGWRRVAIKDMADSIQYGLTASAAERKDGPRFLRITDIQDGRVDWSTVPSCDISKADIPKYRLSSGDLVFARTGATTGKSFLIGECPEAVFASYLIRVRVSADVDSRYLSAFFQSPDYWQQIEGGKRGIGQPNVNGTVLGEVQFPIAPLPEQRRIVAEIEKQFTRLEAGVAALRRVQANLKRYRAAVLKAACEGHLVPTEAELAKTGNQKAKFETGAELLARILTERRKNWQGRGKYKEPVTPEPPTDVELPEAWAWATMPQLGELNRGKSKHRPRDDARLYGGPYPFIQTGDIRRSGGTIREHTQTYSEFGLQQSHLWPEGTLCITIAANIAETGILKFKSCFPDSVVGFTHAGNPATTRYVEFFIRTAKEKLAQFAPATAQKNINLDVLQKVSVPLPPLAEQTRIVAEVERRLSAVEELEAVVTANLQRATRLRQSILQKAFAGELVATVPAIQISDIILPLKPEHIHQPNSHFARALLSAEIVHRLHIEPTFGRIKHQKVFHLCEHIAQIEEIHGQYHREAAGPLDNKLIYANEAELKKQKWYQEVRRESYGHAYQALTKAGGHRKYVERYWADKLPTIEKLIELMRKWDTERCEIFCTAYAAWNDLILWDKQATEDNILHEILERWHDSKKRFPKERWLKAIGWMKKEGFVPTGFGKPTKEAK